MTDLQQVLPTTEARTQLPAAASRFRREGLTAEPIVFGNHRKPEGVMLPFALFEKLLPAIEEVLLAETVRARIADPTPNESFDELVQDLGFSLADFE